MDIVGIDISKATFDAPLLLGDRIRHAVFSNTETGFQQLLGWLAKHRPDPGVPLHVCMEATGNWGLELADFLHAEGVRVSVVNPARIKAYGDSELARNKTDKLDAGLIARFCRAHVPPAWVPAAAHLRELRELVRRCDASPADFQRLRRRNLSGLRSNPLASRNSTAKSRVLPPLRSIPLAAQAEPCAAPPAVARSIAAHIDWLDEQIEAVMDEARHLIASDPTLSKNLALVHSITGFGGVAEGSMRVAHGMATEGRSRPPSCWPNSLRWHSTRCAGGTLAGSAQHRRFHAQSTRSLRRPVTERA